MPVQSLPYEYGLHPFTSAMIDLVVACNLDKLFLIISWFSLFLFSRQIDV